MNVAPEFVNDWSYIPGNKLSLTNWTCEGMLLLLLGATKISIRHPPTTYTQSFEQTNTAETRLGKVGQNRNPQWSNLWFELKSHYLITKNTIELM